MDKLIKTVEKTEKDLNEMTVDKIAESPSKDPEPQTKLTKKQLADEMGVQYIEPKRKLSAFGKLPRQLKKEHARDWEYVKGIYENVETLGEAVEFWYCKYPGDPDCLWSIPANTPVFVPRMIAKHLEEVQKFHRFDYVNQNSANLQHGSFESTFKVTDTVYRGKFRPVEAFN